MSNQSCNTLPEPQANTLLASPKPLFPVALAGLDHFLESDEPTKKAWDLGPPLDQTQSYLQGFVHHIPAGNGGDGPFGKPNPKSVRRPVTPCPVLAPPGFKFNKAVGSPVWSIDNTSPQVSPTARSFNSGSGSGSGSGGSGCGPSSTTSVSIVSDEVFSIVEHALETNLTAAMNPFRVSINRLNDALRSLEREHADVREQNDIMSRQLDLHYRTIEQHTVSSQALIDPMTENLTRLTNIVGHLSEFAVNLPVALNQVVYASASYQVQTAIREIAMAQQQAMVDVLHMNSQPAPQQLRQPTQVTQGTQDTRVQEVQVTRANNEHRESGFHSAAGASATTEENEEESGNEMSLPPVPEYSSTDRIHLPVLESSSADFEQVQVVIQPAPRDSSKSKGRLRTMLHKLFQSRQ